VYHKPADYSVAEAQRQSFAGALFESMSAKLTLAALLLSAIIVLIVVILSVTSPWENDGEPSPEFVTASGKCAQCHIHETPGVVYQFETSEHAELGFDCYDCHRSLEGQAEVAHNGFIIAEHLTAANCQQCHTREYNQFVRSRHAGPAYAAVVGSEGFSEEQIALGEKYHPGTIERPPNALAELEGAGAIEKGCQACHAIGEPNADGTFGSCTNCHSRHSASVELARLPETCGQCHMGPDHSQIEIYNESKHGVLFAMQREHMNLDVDPRVLSTEDMSVPTCSTCHLSGLEGAKVTHDTTERLSYFLFAAVSDQRPNFDRAQAEMKEICLNCHATTHVDTFYEEAEVVVASTNEKISEAGDLMAELYAEGLLTAEPFDEPLEFLWFDLWHYYGRTAKHGAFMGGADFVQWHGNYELLLNWIEMQQMADELRTNARNESTGS